MTNYTRAQRQPEQGTHQRWLASLVLPAGSVIAVSVANKPHTQLPLLLGCAELMQFSKYGTQPAPRRIRSDQRNLPCAPQQTSRASK